MKTALSLPAGIRSAGLGLTLALGMTGCGREFYRNWADQDVTEAVFEKSRDPRWILPVFSIEPPAMSRFADPYDPDRPPAPPDDRAAEALSPVPQWPHHRLLVPSEGTGYLDMLEAWQRDRPAPPSTPSAAPAGAPASMTPPPPATGTSPFQTPPNYPEVSPGPGLTPPPAGPGLTPPANPATAPAGNPPATPAPNGNSGSTGAVLSPIPSISHRAPARSPQSPPSTPVVSARPQNAPLKPRQDHGVLQAAFQAPDTAPPAQPGTPPGQPSLDVPNNLGADLDPNPRVNPALDQPGAAPQPQPAQGEATGLIGILAGTAQPISDAEAAALPTQGPIYLINPAQAMTLALINSRNYQAQLETIYLRSLDVTLARFNLEPQFFAGLAPTGTASTSAGLSGPNNQNSFLYRTREAPGGQQSVLSFGELAGVGKVTSVGTSILAGFANSVVFNLVGQNPVQPTVQSVLPISIVQPFLRGGGRAITLEPLTLAERNLLYQIRSFARFRQQFMPNTLASNQQADSGGAVSLGASDPTVGFLALLQQFQSVDNSRRTVQLYENLVSAYNVMKDPSRARNQIPANAPVRDQLEAMERARRGSTISELNVDQLNVNLLQQRNSLVQATTQFRQLLDQYKIQLGLPTDTPLMIDRSLLDGFRDVFAQIDEWAKQEDENRKPEDLQGIIFGIPNRPDRPGVPALLDVVVDGRSVVATGKDESKLEDVLLAAERIALENRLDLMNARAQVYDQWRQLAVTFNAVKGVFNLSLTNQVFTPPPPSSNPFAFWDQAKQFNLVLNAELPLVRVSQRNTYRAAMIRYRQLQRALMQLEDAIKLSVRNEIRLMIQNSTQYEIQKQSMVVSLKQKDNSQRQLFASTAVGDPVALMNTLVNAINSFLGAQNTLIATWVNYNTQRLALYRDLGIMPIDEWEAYHELFPAQSTRTGTSNAAVQPDAGPPAS